MSTSPPPPKPPRLAGVVGALWGVGGVVALLAWAVYRLSFPALEALSMELGTAQWVFLAGFLVFMVYAEGWRGFHRAFAPRTVARARHLRHHPTVWRVLLAPLFCMCFFGATRKRLIVAYVLTGAIVALVVGVRFLDQPWRGLVDTGVVAGLSIGVLSILYHAGRALAGAESSHPVEVGAGKGHQRSGPVATL